MSDTVWKLHLVWSLNNKQHQLQPTDTWTSRRNKQLNNTTGGRQAKDCLMSVYVPACKYMPFHPTALGVPVRSCDCCLRCEHTCRACELGRCEGTIRTFPTSITACELGRCEGTLRTFPTSITASELGRCEGTIRTFPTSITACELDRCEGTPRTFPTSITACELGRCEGTPRTFPTSITACTYRHGHEQNTPHTSHRPGHVPPPCRSTPFPPVSPSQRSGISGHADHSQRPPAHFL